MSKKFFHCSKIFESLNFLLSAIPRINLPENDKNVNFRQKICWKEFIQFSTWSFFLLPNLPKARTIRMSHIAEKNSWCLVWYKSVRVTKSRCWPFFSHIFRNSLTHSYVLIAKIVFLSTKFRVLILVGSSFLKTSLINNQKKQTIFFEKYAKNRKKLSIFQKNRKNVKV